MTRSIVGAIVIALACGTIGGGRPACAQTSETTSLAGRWALNRSLSQAPREIGFNADWITSGAGGDESAASGGRGRRGGNRGGSSAGAFPSRPESAEDAARMRQLTAEVRNPAVLLTITQSADGITIDDGKGQARTFHPDGREDILHIGDVPLSTTARWEAGQLVIVYAVEEGRQLRYTLSRTATPPQLVVDVKFLEHGGGDEVRRIYEPATATSNATAAASSAGAPQSPDDVPLAARRSDDRAAQAQQAPFNQKPDAELKGLATLGVVVETLSPEAIACGLNQDTLESAAMKTLTDSGFKVLRNSDEDTYLYVDVITTKLPSGLCVSRYDASLYTHATTKLTYQEAPVLVQVSLLHQGGIAGGSAAAHAEGVLKGVKQYIEEFARRIHAANR